MSTEFEVRHGERDYLYRLLKAQAKARVKADFVEIISEMKAKMESNDVEAAHQALEEWKKESGLI